MTNPNSLKPDQFIVKSNYLVEARYRLSLQESRVIYWLLQQIRVDDEDFKTHKLSISEFSKMADLTTSGQYGRLLLITENLMKRVMRINEIDSGRIIQVAWLSSAVYETKKGYVLLEFSPQLKPYLLHLQSQFTKISLADAVGFKSIYAMRLFELLVQYASIEKRGMSVDELRAWCGIEKKEYTLYADLKRNVINRAKIEINAKTEYEVDYEEVKESRKVVGLKWTIKKKTHFEQSQSEKATILAKELRSTTAILEQLLEYGFTKQAANRFVKNHEESNIVNAIKAVEVYMVKHAVKNPRALVETAIKEKWHPEKYAAKKKAA